MCLYSVIKWELCNKSHKCTHKIVEYNFEQGENVKYPILNLHRSTFNEPFVWIENPIWASTQRKKMWPGQSGIFMMKIFSETTEPFKCWFAWNHRIFFFVVLCKGYVFLHQSEIKDDCPCLTLFDIRNISKKEFTQKPHEPKLYLNNDLMVLARFIYIYIYREWMWSSGLGRWT